MTPRPSIARLPKLDILPRAVRETRWRVQELLAEALANAALAGQTKQEDRE